MNDQPVERGPNYDWKHEAEHYRNECYRLRDMLRTMECEIGEQSRLNGMGSEREARLMAKVAELEKACAVWQKTWDEFTPLNAAKNQRIVELEAKLERQASSHGMYITQTLEPKIEELETENTRLLKIEQVYAAQTGQLIDEVKRLREATESGTKRSRYFWSTGGQYTAIDILNEGAIQCAYEIIEEFAAEEIRKDSIQETRPAYELGLQAAEVEGARLRALKSRQETQSVEGSGQGCKSQGADVKGDAETGMEPDLPTSTTQAELMRKMEYQLGRAEVWLISCLEHLTDPSTERVEGFPDLRRYIVEELQPVLREVSRPVQHTHNTSASAQVSDEPEYKPIPPKDRFEVRARVGEVRKGKPISEESSNEGKV